MNLDDIDLGQHARLLQAIGHTQVFGVLTPEVRESLLPQFELQNLAGGDVLFRRGDAAESMYVLCAGRLGVFGPGLATNQERLIGLIAPGDTVGEAAVLTLQPRGVTVRALRDCTLLRLSHADVVQRLMRTFPETLVEALRRMMKLALERQTEESLVAPRTFALLPFDAGIPVRATAEELSRALAPHGKSLIVDGAMGRGRDADWHSAREREHSFVLYLADADDSAWRSTCLRQSDQILLVARSNATPAPWPDLPCQAGADVLHRARRLLLLGTSRHVTPGRAGRWLSQFDEPVTLHHLHFQADFERLARHLAHRATGLVLSGGGARGFAHIGVVRALRELGRPIDAIGGASMGAIVGAGLACEWDDRDLTENLRQTFVRGRPLGDLTVPLIALTRGARTTRLLRRVFGEREIEDLALPFFCVSTNLTRGSVDVHTRGPLWKWLRAGAAIPGILPPLLEAGMVHVDGAVMNNLPTDVMRDRGISNVIAVDISGAGSLRASFEDAALPTLPRLAWEWLRGRQWPSLFSILARAAMVQSDSGSRNRRALATHLLTPPHEDIGLLDWKAHERAIEIGYRHTIEHFNQPSPAMEGGTS